MEFFVPDRPCSSSTDEPSPGSTWPSCSSSRMTTSPRSRSLTRSWWGCSSAKTTSPWSRTPCSQTSRTSATSSASTRRASDSRRRGLYSDLMLYKHFPSSPWQYFSRLNRFHERLWSPSLSSPSAHQSLTTAGLCSA